MAVIAVANQKGGCTKTTTAVHLARWAALDGVCGPVALVDCDPQGSSSKWVSAVEGSGVECYEAKDADSVLDAVPALANKFALVVIDGPGAIAEVTRAILLRCDIALIPSLPTGLDIASTSDTVRLFHQAKTIRDDLKGALFLAKAVAKTRLKSESIDVLETLQLDLLNSVIHQRQVIADSFGQKSTVFDLQGKPAALASAEFSNLFREVVKWSQR